MRRDYGTHEVRVCLIALYDFTLVYFIPIIILARLAPAHC